MKLKHKLMAIIGLNLLQSISYALPCVVTLVKNTCWGDYEVHIELRNIMSGLLADAVIPKNQYWTRVTFDCQSKQTVKAFAAFTPAIFAKDEGAFFNAKRFWLLPPEDPKAGSAWTFTIRFPDDFSNIPQPLTGGGNNCTYDSQIPPVKVP